MPSTPTSKMPALPKRIKVSKPRKSYRTKELMYGLVGIQGVSDYEDWGFTLDEAERLVACWNACVGMADPTNEIRKLKGTQP